MINYSFIPRSLLSPFPGSPALGQGSLGMGLEKSALRGTKLLQCSSSALKPSQPKDGRLVVECNRIRDMANVSSSTRYTPYLYYPTLYHVTLCYTK